METSGDFYDVYPLPAVPRPGGADGPGRPDQPLLLCVADVAGKGISAALVMSRAQALLRLLAEGAAVAGGGPGDVLGRCGAVLHRDFGPGHFVACCAAVVSSPDGDAAAAAGGFRLTLANGGQVPPLLCRRGRCAELVPTGQRLPLGVLPDAAYDDLPVELLPGDAVILASDGLPEAPRGRDLFGFERLSAAAGRWAASGGDAESIAAGIWAEVSGWCGPEAHHDDMTLLVLRVPLRATGAAPAAGLPRSV
jgi:sigma-B regulation protein RsbU (phosphoserine phosphatase)